jgi:hypothetical protein
MVRHAHLKTALLTALSLLVAGCGSKESDTASGAVVYDPWTRHWTEIESGAAQTTLTYVAWPTGNPETAEIEIAKSFPASPTPGRNFEGSLVVTNLTEQTLADLVVIERLGLGTHLSASVPQGRSSADGIYRWNLGNVGPRQSRTIRVTGRVEAAGPITSATSARYISQENAELDG